MQNRQIGIALVTASAVCWSTAGLFVRVADIDTATLVVWASLAACLGLGLVCGFRLRERLWSDIRGIGVPDMLYIATGTLCTITYVMALRYTTVANVMTIYASLPFVATAIAYFWLRERVSGRFVVAGLIAMAGVAITAGAAMSANDIIGLLAGFVMTTSFAVQVVVAKRYPNIDILLATAIAAAVTAAIAAPFMDFALPSATQLAGCALYGLVPYAVGTALALVGGRMIKSGEVGFIAMLDVVLGPVWVWLFFREEPTVQAVIGGALVLIAVGGYLSSEKEQVAGSVAS